MTVADRNWQYPQVPPIGIAYLAASVRSAGHKVTVIDGLGEALHSFHPFIRGCHINGLSIKEIVQRVDPQTDVIGLSAMFSVQWPLARRLLAALREAFPSTPIVVGGEHVTAATAHVFESAPIDYAVIGEGEDTLIELLDTLARPGEKKLQGIAGLAYRSNRNVSQTETGKDDGMNAPSQTKHPSPFIRNPARQRRRDLDSIPWPAWDLFPIQNYMKAKRAHDHSDRRVMTMLGTRGCPYRCRFCSSAQMWTTRFYMRSPQDIVDEMEFYMDRYGATEFQFQDLTFGVSHRWIMRVADEICSRDLGITWTLPSGTRSETFDEKLFAKLSAGGCRSLTFAPESGSKRVLASMRKQADPAQFLELGRIVRRNHIDLTLNAYIIIGSPQESFRDLLQTYVFIIRLALARYDTVTCSRFTCYPGSEYHRRYLERGLIEYSDEYFLGLDRTFANIRCHRQSRHSRWSDCQVRWFVVIAYLLFFAAYYPLRPWHMCQRVVAVLCNKPKTNLEMLIAHGLARRVRGLRAFLRTLRFTRHKCRA